MKKRKTVLRHIQTAASILIVVASGARTSSVAYTLPEGQQIGAKPVIEITVVPPRGGGPDRMERIRGTTRGADTKSHRLVIYSRTDVWYVQPFVAAPFTSLRGDGSFETAIHLGAEYAVLLVDGSFKPPATMTALPVMGNGLIAIARAIAK
jgi:hypothetical protein